MKMVDPEKHTRRREEAVAVQVPTAYEDDPVPQTFIECEWHWERQSSCL